MATYQELRFLFANDDLRHKIEVACIVAAEAIRTEEASVENHANRLLWAKAAFSNPSTVSKQLLMAMLATNKEAEVSAITGVTDALIQAKVDAAIDVFADGT